MKYIFGLLIFLLTIYSIYYDLSTGSLPTISTITNSSAIQTVLADELVPKQNHKQVNINSEEITVEAGYTVLSIIEEIHNGPVNATIQQIIYDFESLNDGISANKIEVGKAYLFPIYK